MMKKAFTMLELVFVIVIMGIIASIGTDIIVNLYDNYIKTRSINKLQSQTELALDQIAKRLKYRIKDSVIARDSGDYNKSIFLSAYTADLNYQVLEWIGKSNESFLGENGLPGWSGFVDVDSRETNDINNTLKTSGSRLDYADNIISALTNNDVSLTVAGANRPAIIFKDKSSLNINKYGWNGTRGEDTLRVTRLNNETFNLIDANATYPNDIYEQYDLAHSAYALVPEGNVSDFNLTLYYNYQPWQDEEYTDGTQNVLMEHVSTFQFRQIGTTIRIKICIYDNQSGDYDFAFCKEREVF